MPAKVVDASVVAAVAFGEPRASEAAELLRGADLYAPPLLAYELTSVARKKALRRPKQSANIVHGLELALSLEIQWVAIDHMAAFRLALSEGMTTYDASYLLLARSLGFPVATFDERLGAVGSRG